MSFILLKICTLCSCFLVIITSFLEGQQNPDYEVRLLPLSSASFMGPMEEAAKSCFCGAVAAFVLGGFYGTCGEGSKILLLWRGCCLCAWRVSSGLWRGQQNPASVAWLLPLRLVGFLRLMPEAAKT